VAVALGLGEGGLTRRRAALFPLLAAAFATGAGASPPPRLDPVSIDLSRPLNTFTPAEAIGAALDGMGEGEVDLYLTPFNIEKMRQAGLSHVTYRSRPELGVEVWHWSDEGTWSDPARSQGYWTGSDDPAHEGRVTWGYSLPRRGDSIDNANNTGYSRLDDGDPATFWKSNPYLDRHFTGLAQSRPQWIVLSFAKLTRFDAARILWGAPFARHFLIQYWDGTDGYQEGKQTADDPGAWRTFPLGDRAVAGAPDDRVLRLADRPIASHFVRILLLASSETGPPGSTDIRDRLGFAVREVGVGVLGADGRFADAVRRGTSRFRQTTVQVSSTDPWHRAIDRDPQTEQPSLAFVFKSGLAGDAPLMVPVGVFHDTPEDAAAEIRYIRRRGWPVTQAELGEEPDGQYIRPEDYADLYLEAAAAIRRVDPTLRLGGPSLQGPLTGTWPDTGAGLSWTGRFIAELKARGALDQLQFFSFEDYAFEAVCRPPGGLLRQQTLNLDRALGKLAASGVPRDIPWEITEYGVSPFADRAMSELPSALLAADVVGHFLGVGGAAAFMFGYTPDQPANQKFPCAGYGNMMLWQADDDGRSHWPMPIYFAQRMMTGDWAAPADQPHRLYAAAATLADAEGRPFVTAYPLLGPDGRWSVMLANRDETAAHRTPISFGAHGPLGAGGPLQVVQYSAAQYAWRAAGDDSRPTRDLPPARFTLAAGRPLVLPAMSLTVVSGAGPAP
jgi:hypothetical protein